MDQPVSYIDVFLEPGGFHFGNRHTRIRTLLGSCVSITMWHPGVHIGGMCHFLMPTRQPHDPGEHLDGRYADEAMEMFMHKVRAAGTVPEEYETKLFGGGSQFAHNERAATIDVPSRNVNASIDLAAQYNLTIKAKHLGGHGSRYVVFDLWTGHVWIRHTETVEAVHGI